MRMLRLNRRKFRYQNIVGEPVPIRDDNGNLTGEYASAYGPVTAAYANISPATGVVNTSYFGADVQYDRVIAAETDLGMNERTRLWIDDIDADRHDYVVKRIAKSINGVLIAVSKVTNRA